MKKSLFVLSVLVLALATAKAKETTLRTSDHGLLGAMKRMGCSPIWLSVVMRQNFILEADLNRLPAGLQLTTPNSCGSLTPNRKNRAISKKILANQRRLARDQSFEKENASLKEEVQSRKDDVERTRVEINKLSVNVVKLQSQLAIAQKTLAERRPMSWWMLLLSFTLGAVAVGAAWIVWFKWFSKHTEILPLEVNYNHLEKKAKFTLVHESRHYSCSLCSAQDIEARHFERHMQRRHSLIGDKEDATKSV